MAVSQRQCLNYGDKCHMTAAVAGTISPCHPLQGPGVRMGQGSSQVSRHHPVSIGPDARQAMQPQYAAPAVGTCAPVAALQPAVFGSPHRCAGACRASQQASSGRQSQRQKPPRRQAEMKNSRKPKKYSLCRQQRTSCKCWCSGRPGRSPSGGRGRPSAPKRLGRPGACRW